MFDPNALKDGDILSVQYLGLPEENYLVVSYHRVYPDGMFGIVVVPIPIERNPFPTLVREGL